MKKKPLVCYLCGAIILSSKAPYPSINEDQMIDHFQEKHPGEYQDYVRAARLSRLLRKRYGFQIHFLPDNSSR